MVGVRGEDGGRKVKEEGLSHAMAASLTEAWSLLLHLLQRRQEVLAMASEFYRSASEVSELPNISSLGSEAGSAGPEEPGSRTSLWALTRTMVDLRSSGGGLSCPWWLTVANDAAGAG